MNRAILNLFVSRLLRCVYMGKVVERNVIGINTCDNNIGCLSYLGSSGIAKINETDPICGYSSQGVKEND